MISTFNTLKEDIGIHEPPRETVIVMSVTQESPMASLFSLCTGNMNMGETKLLDELAQVKW